MLYSQVHVVYAVCTTTVACLRHTLMSW
jgi:hypothetical protein